MELCASIALMINIWLAAKAKYSNFYFGIVAVSLYFLIFLNAKLYAVMSLQLIFLTLQFYGLYQWQLGGTHHEPLPIRCATFAELFWVIAITLIIWPILWVILWRYTDSTVVWLDTLITLLSLAAQYMLSKKWVENWWLWAIVDVCSIVLYLKKSLYYTSMMYFILLLVCIEGYRVWHRNAKQIFLRPEV